MSTAPTPPSAGFTAEQQMVVRSLSSGLLMTAGALLLLAGALIFATVVSFLTGSIGVGLLSLIMGGLSGVSGLVMLTGSADAGYLASTKGYEKEHFGNTVDSINVYANFQLGLAVFACVIVACGLLF